MSCGLDGGILWLRRPCLFVFFGLGGGVLVFVGGRVGGEGDGVMGMKGM